MPEEEKIPEKINLSESPDKDTMPSIGLSEDDTFSRLLDDRLKDKLVGTLVGKKYEIEKRLGEGGMSIVYKARDTLLNRVIALKILKSTNSSDKNVLLRFRQEAKSSIQLAHPNIVRVHEFNVTEEGRAYLTMDYLPGKALSEIIEQDGRLPPAKLIGLMKQVLDALEHAHEHGVIHRDMKPSNVIVTEKDPEMEEKASPANKVSGDIEQAKASIVDFGIAKLQAPDGTDATKLTQTGEIFGSPSYMSPEQTRGKPLDHRSDLYSVGCIMYESLTGQTPFAGDTMLETFMAISSEKAKPIRQINEDVTPEFSAVVMRCLEKSPDKRYQSAAALRKELETLEKGEGSKAYREIVRRRKTRRLVVFAVVAFILAFGSSLVSALTSGDNPSKIKIILIDKGILVPWWQEKLNKARSLRLEGKWDEAERLLIDLIREAREKKLPADEMYNVLGSSAAFYRDLERFEKARDLYRECLAQGDWPPTRAQQGDLALCEFETAKTASDLDTARKTGEDALKYYKGLGPGEDRDKLIRNVLEVLGKIEYEARDFEASRSYFERLLEIPGTENQKDAAELLLARALIARQESFERGKKLYEQAIEERNGIFGEDDPRTKAIQVEFEELLSMPPPKVKSMKAD